MFCPECRALYRPGSARCSDCDVDLVDELSELAARARSGKRNWMSMLPPVRTMYSEGRSTLHWWALYEQQTGTWPWSSIAIHTVNWVVALLGGAYLIWWTIVHHLSRWQFLGVLLLVSLPYCILESWAKRAVKLNYLRNAKRLAKRRK